jgi:hypothetical protein
MTELELARRRGQVALISEFARVQTARAAIIRANVLLVAQRAVLRLLGESDESKWKAVMREELTLALKTAAEADVDLTEEDPDESND